MNEVRYRERLDDMNISLHSEINITLTPTLIDQ